MKQIRNTLAVLVAFLISFTGLAALAQVIVEPTDPTGAVGLFPILFEAVKSSQWTMAAAAAIMILVFVLRKYVLPDMSPKALPWVSAGIAIFAGVAINLGAGQGWGQAIYSGLTVGAGASGLWSLLGQYIFTTPEPKK